MKKPNAGSAKAIALQALEQRFLLDGAAVATIADGIDPDSAASEFDNEIQALPVNNPSEDRNDNFPSSNSADGVADATPSEIVFIDNAVVDQQNADVQDILDSIAPDIPVFFIDSTTDGVEQISAVLSQYSEIDAIHIISHGEQGQLNLGSGILDSQSMQAEYTEELAVIGEALSAHGDILLYGCDFAAGEKGLGAAQLLADLTQADVAASVDDTGSTHYDGDWDLEYATGEVATRIIQAVGWSGILADKDGDGVDDAVDLDDDNDGILDTEECEALAHTDGVRFVVGHHTTGILTPDGRLLLTGDDTQPTGTSNHNTFTEVNPDNGYAYTGNIIDFAIAGLDSPQYILATTDGLYSWGAEGQAVPATYTTGTAFEQIALPPGVNAADVVAVDASNDSRDLHGVAAILTSAGEVWVSGDDHASSYGDGSTVLDSAWHQVLTAPGVPLTGVTELEMSVQGGFAVTAGGVYAWGQGTFLGDGTGASDTPFATLMTLHADFTSTADIVEIELSIEDNDPNSYAMLHSNGKLYTLGSNHRGELGQNTLTADITSWGIVQNPAGTADMENIFFVDGQSHSQRQFVAGFVFLADDPTIAGSSETYFMGRNSGDAMTEGVVGATGLPEIPTYYLASYTDVTGDGNVDEADFNASAIALSSHLSVYYDESQQSFAFSGHNEAGAFGQEPVVEDRFVVSAVPLDLGLDCDTDGDGIPDHLDLDSDNDGISDLEESGQDPSVVDADGDGVVDGGVNADGIPLAANGGAGVDPVDSDGDGLDDYLDLDSDNDGIPDVVEGQPTTGYVPPSGMDSDGDGVDDAWDMTTGHGGDFVGTEDTDSDGTPDYLDTDSDGDGASDTAESGLTLSGDDLGGDGIDDSVNASYSDPDGDVNTPIDDLENASDNDLTDADYRSVNDTDGDGVADFEDLDDDNDGILDTEECEALAHTDGVRFVVGHHTTGILTPDGRLLLTGDDTQPTGTSNHNTFTEVNPDNGYAYTGNIIDFAIAGLDSPQYILATTDGLYSWGAEGQAVPATYTTGTAFEQIALPPGVNAADVVAVDASNDSRDLHGVAAILTSAGEVWVSGDDHASSYGDGSTVLDSAWHQVLTAPGVPLTGVTELEMSVQGGFAVTAGGVYAWGQGTFLGDGTGASDTPFATLMTLHADFTSTADIVEIELSIEDNDPNSYAMLHSNGKLYTLGSNHRGELGQNTLTADITSWGIVQNPAGTADMENIFFVDGQSHSQRQFVAGFVFLADDPTIAGSSETYFMGRNSGDAMTEGVVGATGLPEIPTYYLASYTDVTGDGNVDEADFNASAIALSSHLSVYYDESQQSFAFSGHNEAGAFGQEPVVEDRFVVSAVPLDLGLDCDTDGDGIPDHLDLDSDNDGISDLEESGQDPSVVDVDGDGVVDGGVNADGIPLAANGGAGVDPVDSDGDGLDDYLDLDSDNDGIPDVVEGQPTTGYVPPSGMDSDGDGVDDAWDTTTGHGGDFIGTEDTDSDGTPDYLDSDSDGDGASDSDESGLPLSGTDADGDGIDDGVNASYSDPDGDVNTPIDDLENADIDDADADYRSVNDKDGDGVADIEDLDDDNDGILDSVEGISFTLDANGVAVTSKTYSSDGSTEIPPTAPAFTLAGPNLYQSFDQGTFGTAVVPPDDGDSNTSETVSSATNPFSGAVVDHNGNNMDSEYRQYTPGTSGANKGSPNFGEFSFVANIDDAGKRNNGQAFPVTDPVYGREGRFFTADPDSSAVPTLSDTITGLTPGEFYEYSFWAANPENGNPNAIGVQLGQPGGPLVEVMNTGGLPRAGTGTNEGAAGASSGVTWTRFSFVFQAPASGQVQLDMASTGNAPAGNDLLIDNLELRSVVTDIDTDKDNVPDACDLDSDNDGISDLYESGASAAIIAADTNGDGTISLAEAAAANGGVADADGDGLMDIFDADTSDDTAAASVGTVPVDSDSDGVDDYLDLDSDNDLIADTIEARPTAGYVANDGDTSDNNDADGDGVIDIFDANDGTTGDFGGTHANFNAPVDTDGDGTADYLDEDSDNDNKLDIDESGLAASASGTDADNDGIDDGIAPGSYCDPDGIIVTTSGDLDDEVGGPTEVGFREVGPTIGVAKEVVGTPVQLEDGSFAITYSIAIENTGSVDLANLSVVEDLSAEFGAAFVSASNLRVGTPPSDAATIIALNTGWDGSASTEAIDNTGAGTILQAGDSFTLLFDVIVNPTNAALDNQVTASGTGVDESGNVFTDPVTGLPITATDDSDSGADANDPNAGADGDTGGSDDPTPLYLPAVGLAKQAGDAVPNGDNFDVEFTLVWENTGNVALDGVTVLDDIATEFGAQYVGIVPTSLTIQNSTAVNTPNANVAWEGNTALSLVTSTGAIEPGESFEIVFIATIDPDVGGTSSGGLENQASSTGSAVDANGDPIADASGNPVTASDVSDNGTDPNGENGEDNGDGTFGNDPTPIVIPDISVAKEVFGTPVALPNDNFLVTYQLVVENTGNVDLADVSVVDDLATQFGAAFVSAGSITLVTPPADTNSSITLDSGWNGSATTEMVDQAAANLLSVGDSFTVQFTIEVDPDASGTSTALDNQVTAAGDAVDENGSPLTDSSGTPISVTDDSDNGTDPNGDNGEGGSDDPTPLLLPDVGLAKTAGDAVANGDNFDIPFTFVYENTGTVDMATLSLTDDIAAEFGNAFVGIVPGSLAVQNFAGTGTAPGANAAWEGDTSLDLLDGTGQANIGDSFEVVFTVTIDPDGIDSTSQGLENQGTAGGEGIDPSTGLADPALTATDDSDNGTNPNDDNGAGTTDDPTPIIIADVAAAKEVVGTPTPLANGNFEATYQVVIENTGTVDLANLTLAEDLATQFGAAYVNAYGLTLTTPPADASSTVTLDGASWNGGSATEIVDITAPSALAVGDSFVFEFMVEIDAVAASGVLNNQVTVSGDAVDENGNPYVDASGNPISATDDSDSGAEPSDTNAGAPGDNGTSDDPTPLLIPSIGLAKQAGDAVPNGDNFDVEFTLAWENNGTTSLDNVDLFDDIATEFGAQFVSIVPGSLAVQNFAGTGAAPLANAGWEGDTTQSLISSAGALDVDDTFEVVFTVTIDPDAGGTSSSGLENQATSNGDGLDQNGNPLTDGSGNPITATDDSDNGVDPNGENGEDNGDGTFGNDPTPIIIPDISVAKQVAGTPTLLPNGNYSVTYELVTENTGNVALANLSLIEDLAAQYGTALVSAGNLVVTAGPADASSSVAVDTTWNGSGATEMVDQGVTTSLAVGDSFTVQFTVEVDPDAAGAPGQLNNQVTAGGDAVDENGDPLTDSSGNPIVVTDDSDNGTNPNGDNGEGGSDDPTPLLLPAVGLAKTAGDAVANGDNFDIPFTFVYENTGTVDLANLTLTDDIAAEFGNAFVSVVPGSLAVQNFVGTGTAPGANAAWEGDTALDLLDGTGQANIGDTFEVVFTVTIDPDGIDSVSQGLENQGTAGGEGIDPSTGLPDPALAATDDSDNGTDPGAENGENNGDGVFGNDPTPIIIADIAAAKESVGQPVALSNGNHEATYQVVIENTGTVDLANLTLAEDLATQFGAAYVNAGTLTMITPPADASSTVTLDASNWNGGTATEIVDTAIPSLLAVGDSFVFQFTVEIDAAQATSVLENTVTAGGAAVDENGNPYTDSTGTPITATDDSDSGADPSDPNSSAPGDMGTSDDPTPLYIPGIGLAKQAGDAVANGDNFDVEFTLVWQNTGNADLDGVTVFDDIATEFGAQYVGIVPGSLVVQNGSGANTPLANAAWEGDTALSLVTPTTALEPGETFEIVFSVTIDPDTGGTSSSGLENQATSAGTALDENGSPLLNAAGDPITAVDDSDNGVDPNGENGEDNGDGTFGNDPTPIIIPDISVAKQVAGTPTLLPNGNYSVTYELVTENTGNVALADLTLVEDLATQYGTALVSAGNIVVTAVPTDPTSSVAVDTAWNGSGATEMMDQGVTTTLAVGDSFTVQFTVEVDPDAAGAPGQLNNQVTAGGDAVDENGDPLTDSSGNPIVVTDDSDNGTDPNGDNGEGGSDDPTPLLLPAVGLAKTAGDAVANGDNFDIPFTFVYENTGTVDLANLTLTDDIAAEFGNAFVSVVPGSLAVQNFVGTGAAPGANAAWEGDTALDLLDGTGQANIGDTFEVVFTVTIDPDGIDSVSQGLENQGTAGGEGIDPSTGLPDPALAATDDSDNGTDPGAENGGDDGDGVFGNDPTPIIIADVAAAKEVVGTPTPLANGNFEATYQVVIENTGTVDLANLTLAEDLATQFGAAYVNAYGLTLTTPPADASSTVTLDGASWNGGSATEIVDITAPSALAVGDSFVFEFMVEIDAAAASGVLENQVTVSGDAVDENGNPYVDASGNPISATDDSDSGAEPSDTNAGAPGDNGTSDDPTPLLIPSIGLAKQAGDAVPNGDNFDVEFTLVWENNGTTSLDNVDLFDDIATEFGAQFVSIVPGSLAVQNFAGTGAAPLANAGWEGDTTQSLISSAGALDVDDTFEVVFTVTIDPDAGGTSSSGLENQATSNGDGLDQNGNPLTDGSGNPITATDDSDNGVDPNGENGEDNGDGTFGNDPTPIIIPDISVAKQVAGTPTLLPNGNYSVTYELVTENTGNVALANLSLIEDLAAQYGTALVSAGNLVVTAGPADASSSVAVDTTWNGSGATEMVDQGVTTSLAVGDSFTVQFTVEVDPDAAGAPGQLNNQVTAGGDAVDENGDPLTDSSGNPIVVTDDSDNGTNPNGDNGEGGSDDPTPLLLPAVGLAKTAGDAVANGDNFDIPFTFAYQNTGTVDLTSLSLTDDIASEFGNAFVSVVPGSLAVQNFSGSGSAPGANAGWEADTTQDMLDGTGQLNIGDTFEVTFVVTIDPDGIDSTSQGLENQGSAGSEGIDPASGLPDPALAASDDSDNGTDPTAENGEDDGDGVFGNDPTPIIIADVAAAKQVVGTPTLLANGNFEATYQVVIENTGTVDLANLTLTEDLATQFGSSYVNAYNLTLTTPPTDATSSVTLDGANWNGGSATEAVDLTTPSMLAVGDWFAFEFTVEIANSGVTLENTVTVGVDAVDENGNPYTDASGNPISTVDDSDSGADASGTNPSAPGDNGTSDDPTPISLPGVADLITVKTLISGDSTPDEGSVVTFAIEVLNDGRNAATGVSLNDLLPAGMTATANNGSVTHGSYDAVTGDWSVGSLAVGETAILTLEGIVDAGQGGNTITNITTAAAGDQLDPGTVGDDLDEAVDVDPNADLVTVKSLASGNSTPDEGETVTFQIVVDNNGAAQATNVSLTDLLPAGLTATANNGSVSQGSYDAATGVWAIGTIADGSSATLTLEGIVDAGQGGTTISNFTTAASGDQPDPSTVGDDLDESVAVGNDADLVTVKSLASGDSAPEEGDTVTFQIVVDNNGAAQATNVSLTDLLPAGLTATANNGAVSQGSYDAVTGIWTIGTLADGGSATLTLEGTVDIGAGGNTISNVTTAATGDQPDPSTAGDDLDESVDVPVNPPPVAVDETVTTAPDTPVVIDPLANDSDPDGGVLTITEINGVPLTPGVPQTISVPNGTVTIAADGTITVTPDPGFAGDINIPYTIVDEDGVTASATHIVEVPNPPIAVDETVTGAPGEPTVIDPLANESDPDGGVLTITEINGIPLTPGTPQTISVPNATVTIDADGTITVTPDEGFAGDIDVPYTIIDEDGLTAEASHIVEIPSAVEAVPETIETEPGTPVIVDFLANDIGPNGGTLTLVGEPVLLDPSSGTLTLVGDDWVFTPAPGYTGTAVISYVLQDEFGNTAESTHSVVVAGVSFVAPPVAALTPERVYVDAPPVREIQTTDYERREPLEGELLILSMAQELGSPNIAISAHDLNVQPIEGSKGFSSGKGYRGTHSVDPTDECGRFFIDTIVEKEALSVIARSTIDPEQSSGVIGFSASLASGAPLPDWVAQLADGEYLIDRTADVEVVALKLVAHRQDGSTLIRIVEIDTLTGEIREQENASNFGASFSEELRSGEPPGQTASAAVSQ